jgi:aminoglycoside/choline kinase family phosphotransferase
MSFAAIGARDPRLPAIRVRLRGRQSKGEYRGEDPSAWQFIAHVATHHVLKYSSLPAGLLDGAEQSSS